MIIRKNEPTAAELMTAQVVTVKHDMSVLQAAEYLLEHGVSNAPVVEQDFNRRILRGFVSEKDLIACYASGTFYNQPDLRVSSIMRIHPVCVRPKADLFTLAKIFMQSDYRHLPVAEAQVLLGMVSRRDVLRALVAHYREWALSDPKTRGTPDITGIFTARHLVE
jgi:CBS domain-containing protein